MSVLTPAELELTVLSSLLDQKSLEVSNDKLQRAEEAGICEDSFQVDVHAKAWEYVVGRSRDGASASLADVKAASAVELTPGIVDDTTFLQELAKVTLTRQTRRALLDHVDKLADAPDETISKLVGALNSVRRVGKGRTLYFDADAELRYQELVRVQESGLASGTPTGLYCFDSTGDTWQPGEVCAIMGPLGVGKSSLMFWLAAEVYYHSHKRVLVLSPESTIKEVSAKFDATVAGWMGYEFGVRDLIYGRADAKQFLEYTKELVASTRRDLVIRDSGSAGVFTIDDIVALVRQHEPEFLCIDGFHLIRSKGDSWERMKEAAETVKGLSQGTDMTTMATSQVQRTAVMAPDETAEIAQAAYGMGLSEAANRIIVLAERRGLPAERIFKVSKMRNAAKINFRRYLGYDVDRGRIWEIRDDEPTAIAEE